MLFHSGIVLAVVALVRSDIGPVVADLAVMNGLPSSAYPNATNILATCPDVKKDWTVKGDALKTYYVNGSTTEERVANCCAACFFLRQRQHATHGQFGAPMGSATCTTYGKMTARLALALKIRTPLVGEAVIMQVTQRAISKGIASGGSRLGSMTMRPSFISSHRLQRTIAAMRHACTAEAGCEGWLFYENTTCYLYKFTYEDMGYYSGQLCIDWLLLPVRSVLLST